MRNDDELLTMQQAADALKTTRATLYRWLREGQIAAKKVGRQWRFSRREVARFLDGRAPRIDLPASLEPFLRILEGQLAEPPARTEEPLADAFVLMVSVALEREASSLHLSTCFSEAATDKVSWFRCRVDGVLQPTASLDPRLVPGLIEQWKRMAACDVREGSLPQDGRIVLEHRSNKSASALVELRVSFLPTAFAEEMTVKILDSGRSRLRLDQLEIPERDLALLKRALRHRGRIVTISGRAGSARDSVMAACLREVSGPTVKLLTVQGPVEQFIPWAGQLSLRSLGGSRSYSVAVGTLMRSEPDVIGVGKVADPETLAAVQEAALEGALVVMGSDTDGSVATLRRLHALAGSTVTLAQTLELIFSQRLVRKLCGHCSVSEIPTDPEVEYLARVAQRGGGGNGPLPRNFRRALGCVACGGSGYHRCAMLTESLPLSSKLLELLRDNASDEHLLAEAVRDGLVSLDAKAAVLAAAGLTSVDEVSRFLPMPA